MYEFEKINPLVQPLLKKGKYKKRIKRNILREKKSSFAIQWMREKVGALAASTLVNIYKFSSHLRAAFAFLSSLYIIYIGIRYLHSLSLSDDFDFID